MSVSITYGKANVKCALNKKGRTSFMQKVSITYGKANSTSKAHGFNGFCRVSITYGKANNNILLIT